MRYLALSSKFTIHNLGDCGDFCSANEIAEEYMVDEPIYITTIDEWEKLARAILNKKEEWWVKKKKNIMRLSTKGL